MTIRKEAFLENKQFLALLISLALTNVNFHSAIKVLENNDVRQDQRLQKIEDKLS